MRDIFYATFLRVISLLRGDSDGQNQGDHVPLILKAYYLPCTRDSVVKAVA